jgi:Zn-finger nucleic acid-binding protein
MGELGIRVGRATGCDQCRGVWLDDSAYAEVREQSWARVVEKGSRKAPAARDDRHPLCCPLCPKPMGKTELAHVKVDYCVGHGTWFDPGELEAIAYEIARREAPATPSQAPAPPSAGTWVEMASSMNASLQRSVDTLISNEAYRRAVRDADDDD